MSVDSARIIGRYELQREIGRGMAGAVYLARDLERGHEVALKLIRLKSPDAEVTEAEKRGIYLQEQLARIEPRIAAVYDHGDEGEFFYIAMEHVDGVDLSTVLAHEGALPERRAAEIAVQLCEILEKSHTLSAEVGGRGGVGIIHGDIKPENIRLQGERVRILDFGIAKHLADARGYTRNPFGTPPYTPPERLERGVVDRRSDLWALGVVLYVMLAGRRPFTGDAEEVEEKIRRREPPLPLPEGVAPALVRIVARCLDYDPARRYGSAAEIAADLAALLEGRTPAEVTWDGDDTATRRTMRPLAPPGTSTDAVGATRRTDGLEAEAAPGHPEDVGATRRTGPELPPLPVPLPAEPPIVAPPAPRPRRRWLSAVLLLVLAFGLASQIWATREGRAIQEDLMAEERPDLDLLAERYRRAAGWSLLPLPGGVGEELRQALIEEGERTFRSYHGENPPTREGDWKRAYERLRTAVGLDARDRRARAMMLTARGHLERIEAQQHKDRGRRDEAQERASEAAFTFQKAARLDPDWPDPYLGLARIWAYTQPDLRQLERSLAALEARGYRSGRRETAMLADGYRFRGLSLADEARRAQGQEREKELLEEARRHLLRAMVLYDEIPGFANAAGNRAGVERRLTEVEDRLHALEASDEDGFFEDLFG